MCVVLLTCLAAAPDAAAQVSLASNETVGGPLVGAVVGQSFQPTSSGILTSVQLKFLLPTEGSDQFAVYDGEAVGGTPLASGNLLPGVAGTFESFKTVAEFSPGIPVTAGKTYTITFTGDLFPLSPVGDFYPQGKAYLPSGFLAGNDLAFNILGTPNEAPTLTGAPSDVSFTEDTPGQLDVSNLVVADPEDDNVTLTLTASEGTFAAPGDGSIIRVSATLVSPTVVTLSGTPDDVTSYLETSVFDWTPAPDDYGEDSSTIEVVANDGSSNSNVFIINVDITPVNDPPTVAGLSADVTILEDAETGILLGGTITDADGDELTVILTASAGAWSAPLSGTDIGSGVTATKVSDTVVSLVGSPADITTYLAHTTPPPPKLQYTGDSDAIGVGAATITIVARDSNGSGDVNLGSVNVNITAVNDPPSFTEGGDITVNEDSGPYSATWATDLVAGPPDESGQSLNFQATSTNLELFSVAPALSSDGTLSFTPAPDASGTAVVTATLSDNGGTDSGGDPDAAPVSFSIEVLEVNDAPSVTLGPDITVAEDSGDTFLSGWATDVSAGPANESGQAVSFDVSTDHSLFSVAPQLYSDGSINFVPAEHAFGTATVTVTVRDSGPKDGDNVNTAGPLTFDIVITPVNDDPAITGLPSEVAVVEDTASPLGLGSASFEDPDGEDITVTLTVSAGTFATPGDGSGVGAGVQATLDTATSVRLVGLPSDINSYLDTASNLTYTGPPDVNGSAAATLSIVANDGSGAGDLNLATLDINIASVNDVPAATGLPSDTTVPEDSEANIDLSGTAVEDVDSNSITVTLTVDRGTWSAPASGAGIGAGVSEALLSGSVLTLSGAPADISSYLSTPSHVRYTGAADSNGEDAAVIGVAANDGDGSGSVTLGSVNIDITAVNDPPSFSAGSDLIVGEDSGAQSVPNWATSIRSGPANEADQTLTFSLSYDNSSLFSAGPAIDGDGMLTYTPADDANGSATVTVTLSDDGGTSDGGLDTSAPESFTITVTPVNDPPTITLDANPAVLEETGAVLAGWATGISPGPVDEASQSLSVIVTAANTALFQEQPALDLSTGTLTFSPAPDQNGTSEVSLELSDSDGASTSETFTIEVVPVNDAPSFSPGNDLTLPEDAGSQSITGWASNVSSGAANEATQSLSFLVIASNPALFSELPSLDVSGALTFIPAADASGVSTVGLRLRDNGGTDNGGVDTSESASFTITVSPINDPPVLTLPGPQSVDEDGALVINASVQDVDSASLTARVAATSSLELASTSGITISDGASGSSSVSFFGSPSSVARALASITYRPDPDFVGEGSLSVSVSDGLETISGTVPITVISVNDAPIAVPDEASTFSGESIVVRPLRNDSDPEGDPLSVLSIGQPSSGIATLNPDWTVSYLAPADLDAQVEITYVLSDGSDTTQGIITVRVNGPGPDGDGIAGFVEAGAPNGGDGNGDGLPDAEQRNVASIPVATGDLTGQFLTLATEANLSFEQVLSDEIPDPENAPADAAFPVGLVSFTVSNLEVGQSTVVTVILPRGATVVSWYMYGPTSVNPAPHWYEFDWDGKTGAVIHPETASDPPKVDLHFTDGLRGDHDLLANGIIVDPGVPVFKQNSLPLTAADTATMDEDTSTTVLPLANDTDPDGDTLILRSISTASSGTAVMKADGSVTYTPKPDFFGSDQIVYRVSDGFGTSVQSTISFVVEAVEDQPVAVADSAETTEDASVTIPFLGNDYDPDGDHFYLASLDDPQNGRAVFVGQHNLVYIPNPDFAGTDTFTYSIADRPGVAVVGTVTITVRATNDAPVAVADSVQTSEDTRLVAALLLNDLDVDGDTLRVTAVSQPAHGATVIQADGTVSYVPNEDFFGSDRFTYVAGDGQSESEETAVIVTVSPVNDAPVFEAQPLSGPGGPIVLAANTFELAYLDATDVDDRALVHVYELASGQDFLEVLLSREASGGQIRLDADTELIPVLEAAGLSVSQDITVYQRMTATDPAGARAVSEPVEVTFARGTATGLEEVDVPQDYYLSGNYPNPFNPSTTLVFGLPEATLVRVELYELTGRQVSTLLHETLLAGHHKVPVRLSGLPTGVYLYRLVAGERGFSRLLHLVK
ncbi:MAG: tandem-95 repeat protein [Rhodothermales bacterium]|nr:tandem-95 repeat protein [Rhodothermales bacterium]MBO6781522.1 tandem-95 repeat protein [Rhodothermales bacterium]